MAYELTQAQIVARWTEAFALYDRGKITQGEFRAIVTAPDDTLLVQSLIDHGGSFSGRHYLVSSPIRATVDDPAPEQGGG